MNTIITSSGQKIQYKPLPLFRGVQFINKQLAKENLLLLKSILDDNGINFGLIAGTILGAIREHDFIDHDEDIDLFILSEDRQKVIDVLPQICAAGFEIIRYHRTKKLMSIMKNGQYIDFNFYEPYNKDIRCSGGWLVLDRFLTQTTTVEFLGKDFRVPKDYYGYLECAYGKNWRIPVVWNNYEMSWMETKIRNFFEKIKEILPLPLYNYLLSFSANKEINRHVGYMTRFCNDNNLPMVCFEKGKFD